MIVYNISNFFEGLYETESKQEINYIFCDDIFVANYQIQCWVELNRTDLRCAIGLLFSWVCKMHRCLMEKVMEWYG